MSRHTVRLADKYRPKCLAEVVGQGYAVQYLERFASAPHSAAFLFTGPTGVGKSSAALALAQELGCHPTSNVWHLEAGCQTEEDLQPIFDDLRFAPMGGGWRVVIIEEADWMARCPKAAMRWLSILDNLPTRTVFIFTTNEPEKFPQRFLDRTERIEFVGVDGTTFLPDAQLLIDRVWQAELGRKDAPRATELPGVLDMFGVISYRRVVQALQSVVRSCEPVEDYTLRPPTQSSKTLFQAVLERQRDQDLAAQEISRLAATLPVPTPPPVQLLSPRREPVLKPQNDREREERVTAYLDGCHTRPSSNSLATACGVSFAYAKKMIGLRFDAVSVLRETEMHSWDDIAAMAMSGGY